MRTKPTVSTALTLSTIFGHLLYPGLMALVARSRGPWRRPERPDAWPAISVIIPAYREVGYIETRVKDIEANGYPGEVEVVVVAEDDETAGAARGTDATVIQPDGRMGKAAAINLGVEHASNPYIVVTDANTTFGPDALAHLIAHLLDGWTVAAGEKVSGDTAGENAYWKFESWLKQMEHRAGNTVGVVGELFAMPRAAWRGIPRDVAFDDVWVVCDAIEHGERIAYVHEAKAIEPPLEDVEQQWERRTRIIAGKMWVLGRKRHVLSPRYGIPALQVWGHLFWRASGGPISHLVLFLMAIANSGKSRLARTFLVGHAAGFIGMWLAAIGRPLPKLLVIPVQALHLQVVALAGMVRVARGDRVILWKKIDR